MPKKIRLPPSGSIRLLNPEKPKVDFWAGYVPPELERPPLHIPASKGRAIWRIAEAVGLLYFYDERDHRLWIRMAGSSDYDIEILNRFLKIVELLGISTDQYIRKTITIFEGKAGKHNIREIDGVAFTVADAKSL